MDKDSDLLTLRLLSACSILVLGAYPAIWGYFRFFVDKPAYDFAAKAETPTKVLSCSDTGFGDGRTCSLMNSKNQYSQFVIREDR